MSHVEGVARAGRGVAAGRAAAADRLLLDIFDTIREPLLVLDADLRVTQTNRAFFRTFRVGPDETIGEVLFELGNGQWNVAALRTLLSDRLATEVEVDDVDIDHVFPGIGRKIMQVNARLVIHEPGAPAVILLAIEDITEQRLAEYRLAAQRRELQRSNAALHEFAFVASHDLQEPLRKILSFGERLETTAGAVLDGKPRMYLDRILSAAGRMRTLINDLLAYSQVATSADPFTRVDLTTIVQGVIVDLETVIADVGGRVDVGTLPVVDADPPQMRRLFQNLLGNALKFRRKACGPSPWRTTVSGSGKRRENGSFACSNDFTPVRRTTARGSGWRFVERSSSGTAARSPRRASPARERPSRSPYRPRRRRRSSDHDDARQAYHPDHDSHMRRR
jgi:signal transduction histidine kinase